ncbi:MAG: dihydroneopterin aldolase [Synechococcaceae bacterium WBA_2_066]|nr:dihydroneopterin aldolase [Synechococcaceae bacterium WB6_1A_059]NBP31963.1 dihydroneopterin aldolase [Synechococcaceae bacterium WB6_1B_055]NBP98864.1 dihydroneopterin aldolase [Synechococcaceae bacterium WB6_3A_227]NBQ18261.1 dihydroneopterin aldolase [Synechococcaceae bacterium WB5_2A_257]NBR45391.1 dihydroneopterin aldolase [Synechococcaceae bacterium WB5_2B_268]NBY59143.1 dihydroneopterin aldolase [Synechococcaceae bacterium LLD_019]NCU76506.1 dihydroneopterin aldolase [Synechococcace
MNDAVIIRGLRLWAHVGVLEWERKYGQWFELDINLYLPLAAAGENDDLTETLNYADVIESIRQLARQINCQTIESFSEQVIETIDSIYGVMPLEIELRKCNPPIAGFNGCVAVRRRRD